MSDSIQFKWNRELTPEIRLLTDAMDCIQVLMWPARQNPAAWCDHDEARDAFRQLSFLFAKLEVHKVIEPDFFDKATEAMDDAYRDYFVVLRDKVSIESRNAKLRRLRDVQEKLRHIGLKLHVRYHDRPADMTPEEQDGDSDEYSGLTRKQDLCKELGISGTTYRDWVAQGTLRVIEHNKQLVQVHLADLRNLSGGGKEK